MEKEERETSMYNVTWKNTSGVACEKMFEDLNSAMEWAKELNEDKNYEGTFTTEDALDNLSSNFHIEMGGKAISTYEFFQKHLPLKTVA